MGQNNYDVMTMTLPEDKKDFVKKEVKAVSEKLVVVEKFHEKVAKIENFVNKLNEFDGTLKSIDKWMKDADTQLHDIKNNSDKMTPEDRVSYTMELQEDVAAKVEVIKANVAAELELLPQGEKVPQDADDYKIELKRIQDFVADLHTRALQTTTQEILSGLLFCLFFPKFLVAQELIWNVHLYTNTADNHLNFIISTTCDRVSTKTILLPTISCTN